jgi:hypothetical protein
LFLSLVLEFVKTSWSAEENTAGQERFLAALGMSHSKKNAKWRGEPTEGRTKVRPYMGTKMKSTHRDELSPPYSGTKTGMHDDDDEDNDAGDHS